MKISTATSVFANYPIQQAAQAISEAGFDGIDLWCGRPHLYRKDHSREELRSLCTWLAANHLAPVSCMPAFFRYPYSLSSPRENVRQDSIAYMQETIVTACALSAPFVLVVPTHSLFGQPTEEARARFMDSLSQVIPSVEHSGIKLGIEIVYPALSDYMSATTDALNLIRQMGSFCLGIVLDTGHLNLSGESVEQALKNVGDYLLQIHVNDNDGRRQQNNIPGEGCFNFPRLARLLHGIKYDGFLTVELGWQYSFDPAPAVVRARERIKTYMGMAA